MPCLLVSNLFVSKGLALTLDIEYDVIPVLDLKDPAQEQDPPEMVESSSDDESHRDFEIPEEPKLLPCTNNEVC